MKVNVTGLLRQAASAIDPKRDSAGYAFMLGELADHVDDVRAGRHTLKEFTDCYMITQPPTSLWCCHIIGPDDIHAAPDYETALRWAVSLNRLMASIKPSPLDDPNMPMCVAQVEPWPGDAASHAEALPASIAGMTQQVAA